MQPSPIAETIGPPWPSFRCFIQYSCCHRAVPPCPRDPTPRVHYKLDLSHPYSRGEFFPSFADGFKLFLIERSCADKVDILLEPLRFRGSNNGGVHTRCG